ncbi:porin [Comamonas sp. J-3]|uniref:porin n=1 Tax=Comamonas trifloxystrobinivorans TaxID=3350256 RepID=UPI00372AFFB6
MSKGKKASKHLLIALASSGAAVGSTSVQAQNVTIYGIMDTAVEYVNRMPADTGTASRWGMTRIGGMAPSRWGIRVNDDLGSGWQSTIWLESGFAPDNGELAPAANGAYFQRQASMGIRHADYGSFTMGRLYTTFFDSVINFAPMRMATTYEPISMIGGAFTRENNALKYTLDRGNWHYGMHYSFGTGIPLLAGMPSAVAGGEIPGDSRAQTAYGVSGFYMKNGTGFGMGYDQLNMALTAHSDKGYEKKFYVAGSYAHGKMRHFAGYRWLNARFPNGQTANRNDFFWWGTTYQASDQLALTGALYYMNPKKASLTTSDAVTKPKNAQQLSFLADYALSKRTDLYATVSWTRNAALNFDSTIHSGNIYGYSDPATVSGLRDGQKNMVGFAMGMRIVF